MIFVQWLIDLQKNANHINCVNDLNCAEFLELLKAALLPKMYCRSCLSYTILPTDLLGIENFGN